MPKTKKKINRNKRNKNTCFLISPIGKEGTEIHTQFKDAYEYVIKPAIKNTGYDLEIVRADEIDRSGSFIKDILCSLLDSFIVIADLTNQNPNVFYELGVRHALSPRTIMIAQTIDDVPSDRREYRTIVYDNSAKGLQVFSGRLKKYIEEIFTESTRPDNPVLDRLGSIMDERTSSLQEEIINLRQQLDSVLRKGDKALSTKKAGIESVNDRLKRICELKNAKCKRFTSIGAVAVEFGKEDGQDTMLLPPYKGDFYLYFVMGKDYIAEYWYLSAISEDINIEKELADIRVLLHKIPARKDVEFKFIIATNQDLSKINSKIKAAFKKVLSFISSQSRKRFSLLIWDSNGLIEVEKELGLRVDV